MLPGTVPIHFYDYSSIVNSLIMTEVDFLFMFKSLFPLLLWASLSYPMTALFYCFVLVFTGVLCVFEKLLSVTWLADRALIFAIYFWLSLYFYIIKIFSHFSWFLGFISYLKRTLPCQDHKIIILPCFLLSAFMFSVFTFKCWSIWNLPCKLGKNGSKLFFFFF